MATAKPAAKLAAPYDALLLLSFGGPERPEDVMPFLRNVTRGRGIPDERLTEVARHYHHFGGRSPINDANRALAAAIRCALTDAGLGVPVYWGNRNWLPYLRETVETMRADGVTRAACFVTSAYSSYSSCRQYLDDLAAAAAAVPDAPRLDRLRPYFDHPGFVGPLAEGVSAALARFPGEQRDEVRLVFVTHSLPVVMNETSGPDGGAYVAQHRAVAAEVSRLVSGDAGRDWDLVYCSRSGPPQVPWLTPDVNDHLGALADRGVGSVVVAPIGFVSDHMEVVYDLDTEAQATADRLGLTMVRSATPGDHPDFARLVVDLLVERAAVEREGAPTARRTLAGVAPPAHDCASGCCPGPSGRRPEPKRSPA